MMYEDRYLLDFWGGSHGHFLEYVINCWIFNCPRVPNLFTHTGACHGAKTDTKYRQESLIVCGHFSQFDLNVSRLPKKIIRIVVNDFVGACCYQINVICRAGDIPKKDKEADIPLHIRNDHALLRNDYFSKFSNSRHAWSLPARWKFSDVPNLEVNMSSVYDFFSFLETLKNISDFLENKFSPDQELFYLWQEFIARNQGWKAWALCNDILTDIVANRAREINLEIEQQALLNVLISKTLGIHDGRLFDRSDYPSNTKDIYDLLKLHQDSFDSKF
jgi:hypothetical protein